MSLGKEHQPEFKHIAIAGNIGAGKTTLTKLLAEHYNWTAHFEDVAGNPYLADFYQDMSRWSFNLQIYFLNNRLSHLIKIQNGQNIVVQDRTIYEDAYIFAPNLHDMGLMSRRDFENYRSFFRALTGLIRPPDLLIYLKASLPRLVDNIQKRGRPYEENLRLDYLKRLNHYYNKWLEVYDDGPLLVIQTDDLNFADNAADFESVIQKIEKHIQ